MEKVVAWAQVCVSKQRIILERNYVVPPHMRDASCLTDVGSIELLYDAIDPPKSEGLTFFTAGRQQLHAHANPQYWFAIDNYELLESLSHAGLVQFPHRLIKRADARKDYAISRFELGW